MEQLVRVKETYDNGTALVIHVRESACSGDCHKCSGCGAAKESILLTAENPLTDEDLLLSQLEFNPRTNFRYTESDGTTVVQEEERTLRLVGDGTISYESGGSTALTVAAEGTAATAREAVLGAFRLLDRLFPGGSALCPEEVLREGEDWLISFDYHYDGTRIRRSNGLRAFFASSINIFLSIINRFIFKIRQHCISFGNIRASIVIL